MSTSSILTKLQQFKEIRKRQVFCPVANHRVMVTPLTVADDISLRTMVSSPDIYERDLLKLIYAHAEFPDISSDDKPSFEVFTSNFSNFDKKVLIWGIYDSTYGKLGTQQLTCPECKTKFKETIFIKQLVDEETIKSMWDHEEAFTTYEEVTEVEVGLDGFTKIQFTIAIPSMKKHLDIMSLLNMDEIKDNTSKYNSVLSKQDELALVTKNIKLFSNETEFDEVVTFDDIHALILNYIPLDVAQQVNDTFNEKFSKYDPHFKKNITCPNTSCGHTFDLDVDIEVAMFRSFFRIGY